MKIDAGGNESRSTSGLSRRAFLQTATAGLSLTSGALLLSSDSAGAVSSTPQQQNVGRNFVYGTHFYHPGSGPRPDQFRAMIEAIATHFQFNIIRIYPCWDYCNPKRGEFVFDDLEQLLTICDEFDVRVLMTLLMESAPYWIEEAHPETRFVDATGMPHHLEGSGSSYSGGLPGLCWDWGVVQQAAEEFIHALAKMSAAHRSLYAYDLWNEPQIVRELGGSSWATVPEKLFCYCDRTITEFQTWLQQRYGTLDRLNRAWIRRFPDWKSIDPPRHPIQMYVDWMDWRQFIQERTTLYLRMRENWVRDVDSKHILEDHSSHFPPIQPAALEGTQGWRLAEVVDIFGCSFYPRWFGMPIHEGVALIETTRSCAVGKDFWITEMQASYASHGYRMSPPMRPRELRMWNWVAVAAGAKGIIYWTYLAEGTGREASGFGLVARSGAPTERVEEAAKCNRLIQARWDLLKDYRPKPEVAILFDQDNALLTFAMSGAEAPSTDSFGGYYKAFWNLDLWVDFIEPARINNSQYKVVVVPWHLIGKNATCEALRLFAEQGGTVILETAFSRFDDAYFFSPVIPGHGLDEVFGYREKDSILIDGGKLPLEALDEAPSGADSYEAIIEVSNPVTARLKANTYLTPIEVRSATAIANCGQWTVAARKQVGRGTVYYIGTNLGGSISAGDSGGIDLVRGIISGVVRPPAASTGKLRPRLIESHGKGLLAVFNDTEADQTATINVPVTYRRATSIYSGKQHVMENSGFELTVPFREVDVFDLD